MKRMNTRKSKNDTSLNRRLADVDKQLAPVRAEAAVEPDVVAASWRYLAALKTAIEKADPAGKGLLSIRDSFADEFNAARKDSKASIAKQIMDIETQLAPIRVQAVRQPEVRAAAWQYIAVLQQAMYSKAKDLMVERKQLVTSLRRLPGVPPTKTKAAANSAPTSKPRAIKRSK